MRTKTLILILALILGAMFTFNSCAKDEESTDCPEGTWDSYNDCMDAKQAAGTDLCECETEGTTGVWFMVYDP